MNQRPSTTNQRHVPEWRKSLEAVLRKHNGVRYNGSTASDATKAKRAKEIRAMIRTLREKGYKLNDIRNLKTKHVMVLVNHWKAQKLSAATLQSKLSILRQLAQWINKPNLVRATCHYFPNGEARRSSINKVDKSWTTRGIDVIAKFAEVRAQDPLEAVKLELQVIMGLRMMESIQLQPHLADTGTHLHITKGAKGGKERLVAIDSPAKRALVDQAKSLVKQGDSLSQASRNLKQAKDHFYYVLRKHGITRNQLGVTAHGLRHEYANNRYEEKTGVPSPVRGGGPVDPQIDLTARREIAQELGHCRPEVTAYYLGPMSSEKAASSAALTNQPISKPTGKVMLA